MSVWDNSLNRFLKYEGSHGWGQLDFFKNGSASKLIQYINEEEEKGIQILPPAEFLFRALELTPMKEVKVVLLGQDPYPTRGDAQGLAFSYSGSRRLPASLKNIFRELVTDLNVEMPKTGDLTSWAEQGVLLLNTALTVQEKAAGTHLKIGWQELSDEIVTVLSKQERAIVFMLWGHSARKKAPYIDNQKHLVLEAGHPSPLNRARDFPGCRHFSKANEWLCAHGQKSIDWELP